MKKNLYKLAQGTKKLLQSGLSPKTAFAVLFSMLVAISGAALAQKNTSISGKIMDKQGTLPGVSILEKGTSNGTRSDGNGKFTLTLSSDAKILIISHVGYLTKEVDAKNKERK